MKQSFGSRILRVLVVIVWAVFSILLTTRPGGTRLVTIMTATVARTDTGATIGHAILFAVQTFVTYIALSLWVPRMRAIWAAVIVTLILSTATELAQMWLTSRDLSMADLMANWLGVMVIGFIVASRAATTYPKSD